MQRRPTVGPGSQWTPFREWLPGTISKLGKGTTLQRGQNMGSEGGGVGGGMMGTSGSGNGKARVCGSGDDQGNGLAGAVVVGAVGYRSLGNNKKKGPSYRPP